MLSDEECREIWQTSLARCHPMNDISVAGILTAKAAFALGIERARNAPDAATRAVIERLVESLDKALRCHETHSTMPEIAQAKARKALSDGMAAIAEARKLLEGDGQQKPAAYVLHKAMFDGSPYFTVALANEADALFKDGYDIHQYLYLGPEPTPKPPKG